MPSIKKIFGNTLAFGIIPKIPTFINILILPIITPYLTLDDYGIWGIVSAYCNFFVCLAPLGLHVHLTNSFFEVRKWRIYWGHIFYLFLISGVICSVLYIGFIMVELEYVPLWTRFMIAIFSCVPIMTFGTSTISSHLYPLLSKPLPLVLRNLVASLCSIAVTFIVVFYLRLGYWGWIFGSMAGAIVGFVLFGYNLIKDEHIIPSTEHNLHRIKYWLKVAFPVIPHAIGFMLLVSSSRIIMTFYNIPLDEIGLFSNGYMMGDYVTIVSIALATALSPEIQRAYREKRFTDYRRIFYFCQMTALMFVFVVSCWMPEIYKLFMRNPNLQTAYPIASLICYANVLYPLYNFLATVVFISKDTKHLLWLVFVPGIINVSLCLIFIPIFGYITAVYSTLLSFWSMLLVPYISKFHKRNVIEWLGSRKKLIILLILVVSTLLTSTYLVKSLLIIKLTASLLVVMIYSIILYRKKSLLSFV